MTKKDKIRVSNKNEITNKINIKIGDVVKKKKKKT